MTWITWLPRLVWLGLWFAKELLLSNVAVITDNVTPGQRSHPGIARLSTHCRTEFEVTLLAAMISLTPGTLTLAHHVASTADTGARAEHEGQRILYVHGMYSTGPDNLRASLSSMERHMLAAVRREGFSA